MKKCSNASKIIQMYKVKKSAAVVGAVVASSAVVDSLLSKKANKVLALGVKFAVGTVVAVATEKIVDEAYSTMNEFSIKNKEKKQLEEDFDEEIPEEYIELDEVDEE